MNGANHDFVESRHRAQSSFFNPFCERYLSRDVVLQSSRKGVEWRRGTVYNGGEIQGGFADEI